MVGISLPGLTLPHICAYPKPGPGCPMSQSFFFCSASEGDMFCFVSIGEIVDHHCLNFLFIIMTLFQKTFNAK